MGIGAALGASATAEAADFTVSNLNDSGAGSLRQAVIDANAAPGADRILFQSSLSGTITLTGGELYANGPVEILGPGADQLTVSGNNTSRIVYFAAPAGAVVTVSGLTLTAGKSMSGAAIQNANGKLSVSDSVLSGNNADTSGGAIYSFGGTLTLDTTTISGNRADSGGAIQSASQATTIVYSTISGNTATTRGGGIYAFGGSLTLETSTLSGNSSGSTGGAIQSGGNALTLRSTTVSGNSTVNRGGAIYSFSSTPDPVLANTIIANNTAANGPDVYAFGDNFNATFSLIESPAGATVVSAGPTLTGVDPNLGPLSANGGPTLTHPLLPGSPALDAGNASGFDQRGVPRPFDLGGLPSSAGGNSADIGAYEQSLCGGKIVNLVGTDGTDALTGTPGPDGILGLGGKDKIKGLAGKDGLCGGPGKDKLIGGKGNDRLFGQGGRDTLFGGKGKDKLKGGKGKDHLIQ